MIDITVGHGIVEIEGRTHRVTGDAGDTVALVEDILNRARYSGENISVWVASEDNQRKNRFGDWPRHEAKGAVGEGLRPVSST